MQTPDPETIPPADNLAELEDHLDELWEGYLAFLDQYTKAQHEIKRHMSAGFLALAKAQSVAPAGKRYGRDWYDERMKASRKALVLEDPVSREGNPTRATFTSPNLTVSITQEKSLKGSVTDCDGGSNVEASTAEAEQQPSPPGTPERTSNPGSAGAGQPQGAKAEDANEKATPVDPLRWYGILAPAELKRAQKSFSITLSDATSPKSDEKAIDHTESPISKAVNAARGLREVEAELRRTRKAIRKAEKLHSAGAA